VKRAAVLVGRLKAGFRQNTWWSRLLVAGLIIPFLLLYGLNNRLAASHGHYLILKFAIDDWIPLNRYFVFPYYYWYIQVTAGMLLPVFIRRADRLIYRHILAMCLAVLISNAVFLLMPTYVPRPEVTGQDVFSQMIRWIYSVDYPYNCFPSQHVCFAALAANAWFLAGPRRWWFHLVNLAGLVAISLSTVFIKQHYTPDILGGLLAAWAGWQLAGLIWRRLPGCRRMQNDLSD